MRRLLDAVAAVRQSLALSRAVAQLRRQVRHGAVGAELLADLRRAWGNESWSADVSFLAAVSERALTTPGPCLDCGSGLTTLVTGVIADHRGVRVWSLEQDEPWYRRVCRALDRFGIQSVELWHAPLRAYGDFAWFDVDDRPLPPQFAHVFCDGPAVFRRPWPPVIHANWRVGVVPILQRRGISFGEIILDDAEDARSEALRRSWAAAGVATEVVATATGSYIRSRARPPR